MATLTEEYDVEKPYYKVGITVPSFEKVGALAAAFKQATDSGSLGASQWAMDEVAGSDAKRVIFKVEYKEMTDKLPPQYSVMQLVSHALSQTGIAVESANVSYENVSGRDKGRGI
jgi:hypothetical protein